MSYRQEEINFELVVDTIKQLEKLKYDIYRKLRKSCPHCNNSHYPLCKVGEEVCTKR